MCLSPRFLIIFSFIILFLKPGFSQQNNNYDFRDAEKFFNEENWPEATAAFKYLAENNVYNGYYWDNYGYCLYTSKQYDKAIECFKKAIDAGYGLSGEMYNIACCYSLMNKPETAIEWLNKSADYKISNLQEKVSKDSDFDPVRNTAIFKQEIIPSHDMYKTRSEGWKADIKYYKERMERTHYDLFRNITKDEWDSELENLSDKIDELDDNRIITELYKITSRVGDGHTTIFPPAGSSKIQMSVLPLTFWLFEDGLYIVSAPPEYKNLAGKKVLKIGNTDAANVLNKVKDVVSRDNEFGLKWMSMRFLGYTEILYGLEILKKYDEADITVEGGEKTTIKAIPFSSSFMHMKIEAPGYAIARDTTATPLYLKDLYNNYWYIYLPDQKMVYMQYNSIQDKKEEPLDDFISKMFDFINKTDVNYFVLDIRFNNGGNSFLNKTIIHNIIKCDKINSKGKFFAITGRSTFSAAMNLTGDLERETNVIFAGEPTGSKPCFVGETNLITLPYSGLRVSCSSRYWQNYLSDDYRKWIAPALGVKYTFEDYKNNIDPAMVEIIKFINKMN